MPFVKGQSGNTKGRPPGPTARSKFREQVDAAIPGIVANLVQQAQAGDMQAASLILNRCIPALKPTSDPAKLVMPRSGSLSDKGERIIAAAMAGTVAPDEAKALIDMLSAQAKLIEQSEIVQRLESIETWLKNNSTPSQPQND